MSLHPFSITFDTLLAREIGLYDAGHVVFPFLCSGITVTVVDDSGITAVVQERLRICRSARGAPSPRC